MEALMASLRLNKEWGRPQNQSTPSKATSSSSSSTPLSSTPPLSSSSLIEYESDTLLEKKEIVWKVKNISALIEMAKIADKTSKSNNANGIVNVVIDSFKFSAGDTIQMSSRWELCLQYGTAPKRSSSGENNETGTTTSAPHPSSDEGLGIYLQLLDYRGNSDNVFAQYTVTLKLPCGSNYLSWKSPMRDWKPSTHRSGGWHNLITPEELRKSNVILDDSFTIYVDFTIRTKRCVLTTPTTPPSVENEKSFKVEKVAKEEITRQFGMVLEDGTCSDFNIKIPKPGGRRIEYETFKVHKVVLAARSSVFKAMLEANMEETKTGEVVITDVSPLAMKILLKFIYTGILEDEWILTPEEVILAADKYHLVTMKDMCEKNFAQVLAPSNALQMMKLSKVLNLQKASKLTMEYLKSHLSEVVNEV